MTGKIWEQAVFSTEDELKYIDLANVPNGVYTCMVVGSNGERRVLKISVIKP